MRGLLRTAYVRRITVQYLTVLLYDGNAACSTSRTRCSFSAHSHLLVDEKKPPHVLLLVPSIAVGVLRM